MGKPLSSSERRGLLWVAGAALMVILAGILTSRCESSSGNQKAEEEIVVRPVADSLSRSSNSIGNRGRKGGSKKKTRRKASEKKAAKECRRRDPRHEPVDSILP